MVKAFSVLITILVGHSRADVTMVRREAREIHEHMDEKATGSDGVAQECAAFNVLPPSERHVDLSQLLGKLRGEAGGEWSACTHLREYGLNFAPFLARFLTYQLQPATMLEFGSGLGTTSDFVARFAEADVTSIEPDRALSQLVVSVHPEARSQGPGRLHQLAVNIFDEGGEKCAASLAAKKFDLVTSFEVAEHIPHKYHGELVRFLTESTKKWLVFSAARPGQIGTGHLDASMLDHAAWVKIFQDAGLVYMPLLTKISIRSAWYPRAYDFGTNLMVFKHPSNEAVDTKEPHEMLKHYWEGGFMDNKEPQDTWNRSHEFMTGVESSLWPELSQLSKQVQDKSVEC